MTKRKKTVRERYHTLVGANRWWQGDGLPTEMLRAVSDMKQQLIMMNEYGPYVLEVPIALRGRFQQNYSTFGTNTIHERLSATDGLCIEYVAGIKVPRLVPVCEDVVTGSDPDHPRCKCDPSPIGSRHELEVELIKKTEYVKVLEGRLARLDELSDIQPESNVIDDLRKIITNLQEKYIAAAREKYNLSEQSRLDGQKIAALRQHVSRL